MASTDCCIRFPVARGRNPTETRLREKGNLLDHSRHTQKQELKWWSPLKFQTPPSSSVLIGFSGTLSPCGPNEGNWWARYIRIYKILDPAERKCCLPTLWEDLICPVWVRCSFWTNAWGQEMECSQWSGWVLCPPTVPGDGQEWHHANSTEWFLYHVLQKVLDGQKPSGHPMAVSEIPLLHRSWQPS